MSEFGLSLHLLPYFVFASSKGSVGDTDSENGQLGPSKPWHIWDKYQNIMYWHIYN